MLNSFMISKISGIYKIINKVNDKFYIGSSNDIKRRWGEHKRRLNGGRHLNPHLQSSWDYYGEDAFDIVIVEICSVDKLIELEQSYIDLYECYKKGIGYNINQFANKTPDCTGIRRYDKMKPVYQYKMNGDYIRTFMSARDAAVSLGKNIKSKDRISCCCNGRSKSSYGFIWSHVPPTLNN